jgi:hypothetical protein
MPEPVPEPAAGFAPRPAAADAVRSYQAGTCTDCKPGESAASAVRFAAASGGPCPAGWDNAARQAVAILEEQGAPALAGYTGPLFVGGEGEVRIPALAGEETLAEVERLLAPWTDPAARCQLALVVLERGVKLTGYRYEARDATGASDCLAGRECPVGDALWAAHPTIERSSGPTFIWALFENQSADRNRRGELTVYFDRTP